MPTLAEIDAQFDLERYAIQRGVERLQTGTRKLERQSYASSSVYGQSSIRTALTPVVDLINSTGHRVNTGNAGKHCGVAGQMVQILDAESMALITLKTTFDLVFSCKHQKDKCLQQICLQIGKAIENEGKLRYYSVEAPQLLEYVKKKYWHQACGTKQKSSLTTLMMNRKGIHWESWKTVEASKVGGWLLDCVMTATGWFQRVNHGSNVPTLEPTPEFLEIREHLLAEAEKFAGDLMPMLIPPRDWTHEEPGGYLLNTLHERNPMVRRGDPAQYQGEVPLRFLNRLQRTAYTLNRFIVEVAEVLDKQGVAVGKFLPIIELPLPQKPHDIATNDVARLAYRRAAAETMNVNAVAFRRNVRTRSILAEVDVFKDHEKFYLPWSYDYRGRAYPIPPYLSHQDTDFGKSLLKFAEVSEMTPEADYWLGFQVATSYGLDKATMDERQEWVTSPAAKELITRIATYPLDNISEWEAAEEPWQFLAACDEYYHCVLERDRKTTNLPVAIDATCSGLQILAGLSRDRSTAQLVNVVPGEKPMDAYKVVAEVAKTKLPENLAVLLDRKVTKRTVMTIPYNATKHSNRQYIRDALKEKGAEFTPDELTLIVNAVREAMEEVVPGPMRVMKWIKEEVSKAFRERGAKKLTWTTPSGFVIKQKHNKYKYKRISLQLLGRYDMKVIDGETPEPNLNAHKACTAPNLIHSLDASLLHLSFEQFDKPFTVIHDSVLCRATDMKELNEVVRKTYHLIFSQNNILASFAQSIGAESPPPIVGDLELSQVLDSTYFFS